MTMRRFPHYLRPLGIGKWPQAIICVDATSSVEQSEGPQITRRETLTGWYAALLTRSNNTYIPRHSASGQTVSEWWTTLARTLERTQHTWIVSYRACRVWALLGLWEELENGQLVLVETRFESEMRRVRTDTVGSTDGDQGWSGRPGSGVRGMLERESGYLVAEDPPNILRARIADQARWFQWVDLRNYGVECPEGEQEGVSRCNWISGAVIAISGALHTYKMGGLRATAGSQALAGFRSSYYNGGIYCHNHKDAISLEAKAYYGGRCECRNIGVCEGTVYHLDFRSLYPSVCVANALPVRLVSHHTTGRQVEIETSYHGIGTIAEVDIETDEPAYPYRRVSGRESGNAGLPANGGQQWNGVDTDIIYPIGRFRTVLAGPELQDAINHGRVCMVHQLALYEMEHALRDYAIAMHNMRCNAESYQISSVGQLAKSLSVCIAGKFGQRLRIWECEPSVVAYVPYGEWYGADRAGRSVRYRSIGWTTWREVDIGWSQEAVPSIAAWITSAGRIDLLGAIRCAGLENVYYYDTDSLFTNEAGYERLRRENRIASRTLGYLQLKGNSDFACFTGIKEYAFGDNVRSAGTPKGYYADAGDGQHYWHSASASADIRKGQRPQGRSFLGHYRRDGEYRHGVVHDNGLVTPIVLKEW